MLERVVGRTEGCLYIRDAMEESAAPDSPGSLCQWSLREYACHVVRKRQDPAHQILKADYK